MREPVIDIPRSTEASDYQNLPQPIAAMAKSFADGFHIPLHFHDRDQLLYAVRGVMRLRTKHKAWVVPCDRAVYIPANTPHSVSMHGTVDMRTLYIAAGPSFGSVSPLKVLVVSNLLRELILALSDEPIVYGTDSRGERIAGLIELELSNAPELSLGVPLPNDPRLQRLCAALLANPADRRTLDSWSQFAGASPRTLARLFECDIGMKFSKWRQLVRFHNALESISAGEPVSRVALQNGYQSASAFSAAFIKEMGIAPSRLPADDQELPGRGAA